jgi:PTS system sucrose-specific IIC component
VGFLATYYFGFTRQSLTDLNATAAPAEPATPKPMEPAHS